LTFDAAIEHGAYDTLIDEMVSYGQAPARHELGHASRRARSTRRSIDGIVSVEDGVARVCFWRFWLVAPHDVADAADALVLRVYGHQSTLRGGAHQRAQALDFVCRHSIKARPVGLRFNDDVEISTVG